MPTLDEMKEYRNLFGEKATGQGLRPKARPTFVLAENGKTCKDCKHAVGLSYSKTYYKCELVRARWTSGTGTDIRLKDPACGMFEPEDEEPK